MPTCLHKSLEYVGEQKTDEGANTYYTCKECGEMLVVTPSKAVYGVPGVQPGPAQAQEGEEPGT